METLGVHVLRAVAAGVAPWRFVSRGASDILHDHRRLRQFRAAARPPAAASSLELGGVRRVLVAGRRRAEASPAAIGRNADGVSCTVWSAGPCWRSVS